MRTKRLDSSRSARAEGARVSYSELKIRAPSGRPLRVGRSLLRKPSITTLPRPMKADRRHQLASNALARELEGLPDKLKRWGSTGLTIFLVAAAIGMLIRWRMQS